MLEVRDGLRQQEATASQKRSYTGASTPWLHPCDSGRANAKPGDDSNQGSFKFLAHILLRLPRRLNPWEVADHEE